MTHDRIYIALGASLLPLSVLAHDSFLPLHHHSGLHEHEHGDAHEVHGRFTEQRFGFASGGRYTRYSTDDGDAHLWECGVGIDCAVLPWLHVGGEVRYGWFDSMQGNANGWLMPNAHLDLHLPFGQAWEGVVGLGAGIPAGEEALRGDEWEWTPHLELRYDRGAWFVEAGVGVLFAIGGDEHHEHTEEESEDEQADEEHAHEADFHDIVDPHGERELQYFLTAGVRLLDRRLTLESQVAGTHVLTGETDANNYVRAVLRATYEWNERVLVTAEGNGPITNAERNEWQISLALRMGF